MGRRALPEEERKLREAARKRLWSAENRERIRAYRRARRAANPELARERDRLSAANHKKLTGATTRPWYFANREKAAETARKYRETHKNEIHEANQRRDLLRKYGLSQEAYSSLSARQGSLCAICQKPESVLDRKGRLRRLTVDHDHKTGALRGLLCFRCNTAIGKMSDDPARLRAAADYIEAASTTYAPTQTPTQTITGDECKWLIQ